MSRRFKKLVAVLLFLAIFLVLAGYTKAETQGEGLTISPPILEITVKVGETSVQKIRVTNPTSSLIEVYPTVMNFGAGGENGDPKFSATNPEETKFSLGQWIKFSQTKLALTPNQIVEFEYSIVVPTDAEAGGHYGVVFFSTQPPDNSGNQNQIAISSMIGSLVLVKVPGAVIEKGFLESFKAQSLLVKPPVVFDARISNLGNIHFKPAGNISIKGMFGDSYTIPINQAAGNVLPDSTRKFEEKWSPGGFKIGRYTAKLDVVYGENEKTLSGQTVFWILPIWFIACLALVVVAVVVLAIFIRRRR